jgi:hypothetical protein
MRGWCRTLNGAWVGAVVIASWLWLGKGVLSAGGTGHLSNSMADSTGLAGPCPDDLSEAYPRRWCRGVTSGLAETTLPRSLHGGAAP